MNSRMVSVVGLLFVASLISQFSGFSSSSALPDTTQQAGSTSPYTSQKISKKYPAQAKPTLDKLTSEDRIALLARSELGPWVASCAFARDAGKKDRSESIALDLEQAAENQVHVASGTLSIPGELAADANRERWCLQNKDGGRLLNHAEFLIATVPDPVNTHLALEFDRRIEAIQWAAQDTNYLVDQFWMPWKVQVSTGESDTERARIEAMLRELRSSQPGLQIFSSRSSDAALFVFLVGETPTTGVSQPQLLNALQYVREISEAVAVPFPKPIRILGPGFSGSAYPLAQTLRQRPASEEFYLVSGSATNESALEWLNPEHRPAPAGEPWVYFDSVLTNDEVAFASFRDYLHDELHIEYKEIALLSESGTEYGVGMSGAFKFSKHDPHEKGDYILSIRFPREISTLRSAYPDQSQSAAAKTPAPPTTGLPLDLRQSLGNEDDIPPFSAGELPMSQEAVLMDVAATLRREKIKAVGISATDIFDMLFLARFLREFCPDIRIFTMYSDQLLVRAADSIPLDGTLSVSNYPLFSAAQRWTGNRYEPLLSFSSSPNEGTYNAFLALMAQPANGSSCQYYCLMRDMSRPPTGPGMLQPALWLTVVSRNGYWPVTELVPQNLTSKVRFRPDLPSGGYLFLCGFLVMITVAHVTLLCAANLGQRNPAAATTGKPASTGRALSWLVDYFSLCSRTDQPLTERTKDLHVQKTLFVSSASLALASADLLTFWPVWRFILSWAHDFDLPEQAWYGFLVVATVLATGFAMWAAIYLFLKGKLWRAGTRTIVISGLLFAAIFLFCWRGLQNGAHQADFFFSRSLEIESGVSPIVPYILLLAGIYAACWAHIRRLRFVENRSVQIPCRSFDQTFHTGFGHLKHDLDSALDSLFFSSWSKPILIVVFLMPALLRGPSHIMSFEAGTPFLRRIWRGFDDLLLAMLALLFTFVVSAIGRFLSAWGPLRQILRRLERQRLRYAFDRLPKKHYSWTSLWHAGGNRKSFVHLTRSVECLRKLEASGNDVLQELPRLPDFRGQLEANVNQLLDAEAAGAVDTSHEAHRCEIQLATTADYIIQDFLVPRWLRTGHSDSLEHHDERQAKKADSKQRYHVQLARHTPDQPPPVTPDEQEPVVAAEEFVALRFVSLINYVGVQLRNLISFVSLAFILCVAALRSYPFLSHRTIGWTLTLLFLALGIPVVMVFAQMDRDAILSRLADTEPGKLDKEFYLRLVSYGALPLLTLLASQFPAIGRFLFSWVQPAVEALH